MNWFLLIGVMLVMGNCSGYISQEKLLEENSRDMAQKYDADYGTKTNFLLCSPDSLVSVRLTKGEWIGEKMMANYVVFKDDSVYVSNRKCLMVAYKKGEFLPIIGD